MQLILHSSNSKVRLNILNSLCRFLELTAYQYLFGEEARDLGDEEEALWEEEEGGKFEEGGKCED